MGWDIMFEWLQVIEASVASAWAAEAQAGISFIGLLLGGYIAFRQFQYMKKQNEIAEMQANIAKRQIEFTQKHFEHEKIYASLYNSLDIVMDYIISMPVNLDDFDDNTCQRMFSRRLNKLYPRFNKLLQDYKGKEKLVAENIKVYVSDVINSIEDLLKLAQEVPSLKTSTIEDERAWEEKFASKQEKIYHLYEKIEDIFVDVFPSR